MHSLSLGPSEERDGALSEAFAGVEFSIGSWGPGDGDAETVFRLHSDIRETDFENYVSAAAAYRQLTEQPTYDLLARYRHELKSTLAGYGNLERVGGDFRNVNTGVMNVTLIGQLTSWLAMSRLYLESTRDFLLTKFGEDSPELGRFRQATAAAFDGSPGYRFLYNLRDYTQHCGVPHGGTTVLKDENDHARVELYLSRSDLSLARFNWNRHALELLSTWPEQIFVLPLVEEATSAFRDIHGEVLTILLEECTRAVPILRAAIEQAAPPEGHRAAVFRHGPREDGSDGLRLSYQTLPQPSDLEQVEAASSSEDPLAAIRRPRDDDDGRSSAIRVADARAAAVITAWIEHPASVTEVMNRIIELDDGDITPLVSGFVNLSAYYMSMLGILIGSTPQSLLGSFAEGSSEPLAPN